MRGISTTTRCDKQSLLFLSHPPSSHRVAHTTFFFTSYLIFYLSPFPPFWSCCIGANRLLIRSGTAFFFFFLGITSLRLIIHTNKVAGLDPSLLLLLGLLLSLCSSAFAFAFALIRPFAPSTLRPLIQLDNSLYNMGKLLPPFSPKRALYTKRKQSIAGGLCGLGILSLHALPAIRHLALASP